MVLIPEWLAQSNYSNNQAIFFIFTFHFNLFSTLNYSAEALLNSLFQRTL